MSLRTWWNRLSASVRRQKLEDRLEEEMLFHLQMRAGENGDDGQMPGEAQQAASARFGNVSRAKELCRDIDTLAWLGNLQQDLRYAARAIRKSPGFSAASILCLAMGIAANTAIFGFVNAFLLRPLPVYRPETLVTLGRQGGGPFSYSEYLDWRNSNRVFSGIAVWSPEALTIGRGFAAQRVLGEVVNDSYFAVLGVQASAGRTFGSSEDEFPLAVIGQNLWKSRFNADQAIVGQAMIVDHEAFTIVGIAPAGFSGMVPPWTTEVWVTPAKHRDWLRDRNMGWLQGGAARLNSGVTLPQAQASMTALDAELQRAHPDPQGRTRPRLDVRQAAAGSPLRDALMAPASLLMIVVGAVFLIACANVAGLLTARYLVRRREIAIRLSLGASRWRLVRQFLTEMAMLSLLGGIAGVALSVIAGRSIESLLPKSITGGFGVNHAADWRVVAFSLSLTFLTVLLCGVLPAIRSSGQDLSQWARSSTVSRRSPRLRQALTVVQVTLALVVLVVAGLFIRSLGAVRVDAGFETQRVLAMDADLHQMRLSVSRRAELYQRFKTRIAEVPGVQSVSWTDSFPLGNSQRTFPVSAGDLQPITVAGANIDAQYLETMGIKLSRGRAFQSGERNVVIVNETLAGQLWPGQEAVGKAVRIQRGGPPQDVIGVTQNGKYWSPDEPRRPFLYVLAEQPSQPSMCLAIRTAESAEAMVGTVRVVIRTLDDDLPTLKIQTAGDLIRKWQEPFRSAASLLSVLGLAALGLAIAGIYGLIAQLVAQRTPEIAIRMALGVPRANVLKLITRQTAFLMMIGLGAGAVAGAVVSRTFASMMIQVSPTDGFTFAAASVLILIVGLIATLVPARRAMRIDPAEALRAE